MTFPIVVRIDLESSGKAPLVAADDRSAAIRLLQILPPLAFWRLIPAPYRTGRRGERYAYFFRAAKNEKGGMRRTHLRGQQNILKRQLIHVGAFNLSLILRQLLGAGKHGT